MDDHFDIGCVFEIGKFDITRLTCKTFPKRKFYLKLHLIFHFCCNNYMKCTKYETCAKLYTFPAVLDLHSWHALSMVVDEGSGQTLEFYLCWIRQRLSIDVY